MVKKLRCLFRFTIYCRRSIFNLFKVAKRFEEITDFSRTNDYPKGSDDTFPKFSENLERI
jgi:hypothetical protein